MDTPLLPGQFLEVDCPRCVSLDDQIDPGASVDRVSLTQGAGESGEEKPKNLFVSFKSYSPEIRIAQFKTQAVLQLLANRIDEIPDSDPRVLLVIRGIGEYQGLWIRTPEKGGIYLARRAGQQDERKEKSELFHAQRIKLISARDQDLDSGVPALGPWIDRTGQPTFLCMNARCKGLALASKTVARNRFPAFRGGRTSPPRTSLLLGGFEAEKSLAHNHFFHGHGVFAPLARVLDTKNQDYTDGVSVPRGPRIRVSGQTQHGLERLDRIQAIIFGAEQQMEIADHHPV